MRVSRRSFMGGAMAAALAMGGAGRARGEAELRIGACDWSMGMGGDPEALDAAAAIGLDGVEISASDGVRDVVSLADADLRQAYKDAMARSGATVYSVGMTFLNNVPFARDPRGPAWLEQTIDAAADLGAGTILMAFFHEGDLFDEDGDLREDDVDALVERLRAAAPKAADAGVILGIENWLSAEQNLAILDRVDHGAVQVYYDVRNSNYRGYDPPAEIRQIGRDRIAPTMHFKDGPGNALGEGEVNWAAAAEAIRDIGYRGWITLETAILSDDRDASFRRNADFVRDLFDLA